MSDVASLLPGLKVDLGIMTTAYDDRLMQYLDHAEKEIAREGVTIGDRTDDGELTIMYAAWLWRRRDGMEGMPRMLRYALNNRVFSGKMSEENSDG